MSNVSFYQEIENNRGTKDEKNPFVGLKTLSVFVSVTKNSSKESEKKIHKSAKRR